VDLPGTSLPRRTLIAAAVAAGALLANLAGLLSGITVVVPHLLYIPIALAGYWFPRRGTLIAAGVAVAYATMALAVTPGEWLSVLARAVTLVAVGALVAHLSRRLRSQEERYRGLFDSSVAAILVLDADGVVQEANPRATALLGREDGGLVGRPLAEVAADPEAVRVFLALAARGPVDDLELVLSAPSGTPVHGLASGAPLGPGSTVVSLADVTERYLARSALESANRTMGTLARILDQDLAATVGDMDACLERGRATVTDPETLAVLRRLGAMLEAIARSAAVAREFRRLGRRPAAWQRVEEAVEEAVARLDPGPVVVRAWVARLEVYADPTLPSALYHFLHNATRPGTGATAVLVTCHHGPDGCRIWIEDDGTGVPPAERGSLFSPTARRYGHGLYFARESLGITGIGISEEGAGSGARFVLTVPLEGSRLV